MAELQMPLQASKVKLRKVVVRLRQFARNLPNKETEGKVINPHNLAAMFKMREALLRRVLGRDLCQAQEQLAAAEAQAHGDDIADKGSSEEIAKLREKVSALQRMQPAEAAQSSRDHGVLAWRDQQERLWQTWHSEVARWETFKQLPDAEQAAWDVETQGSVPRDPGPCPASPEFPYRCGVLLLPSSVAGFIDCAALMCR